MGPPAGSRGRVKRSALRPLVRGHLCANPERRAEGLLDCRLPRSETSGLRQTQPMSLAEFSAAQTRAGLLAGWRGPVVEASVNQEQAGDWRSCGGDTRIKRNRLKRSQM
jgi:hypothetical protein